MSFRISARTLFAGGFRLLMLPECDTTGLDRKFQNGVRGSKLEDNQSKAREQWVVKAHL